MQAESGATVHIYGTDAPLVSGEESPLAQRERLRATVELWGIPEGPREELSAVLDDHAALGREPVDVTAFVDGDTFDVNGRSLEAVHLPGTAGLTAFADADTDEAFVCDAILPEYTPNVGGADVRIKRPLGRYVESLLKVPDRDCIADPAGRAATILRHHRERTVNVVDVLERGPATPWEVSADLFGALGSVHVFHGPGEAFAHLDHLAAGGVVDYDDQKCYLTESDRDVDALFSDVDAERVD